MDQYDEFLDLYRQGGALSLYDRKRFAVKLLIFRHITIPLFSTILTMMKLFSRPVKQRLKY